MAGPPLVGLLKEGIHKNGIFDRQDLDAIGIDLAQGKLSAEGVEAVNIVLEEMFRGRFPGTTSCYLIDPTVREDLKSLVEHGLRLDLSRKAMTYDSRGDCLNPSVLRGQEEQQSLETNLTEWHRQRIKAAPQLGNAPIWLDETYFPPEKGVVRRVYFLKGYDPDRVRWLLSSIEGQWSIWHDPDHSQSLGIGHVGKNFYLPRARQLPLVNAFAPPQLVRAGTGPLKFTAGDAHYAFMVEPDIDQNQ